MICQYVLREILTFCIRFIISLLRVQQSYSSSSSSSYTQAEVSRTRRSERSPYPFIPVSVTPWMKYFWAKKKMIMIGRVIISDPAIIMPMLPPACTLNA